MKKILLLIIFNYPTSPSFTHTTIHHDPRIEKMVSKISKDSPESFINKLVSFGTRNKLNTKLIPKEGLELHEIGY